MISDLSHPHTEPKDANTNSLIIYDTQMIFSRSLNLKRADRTRMVQSATPIAEKTIENECVVKEQNILPEQRVKERTKALNDTVKNLKDAQAKLVQLEKLASLGELTAGIAHEIQNPLNFVNNFADINMDLLAE